MKRFFILIAIAGVLASCSKDKYETVPQVKIESFGPKEVVKGQLFRLTATITDKQGDIRDSSVLIIRKLYLQTIVVTDTISKKINQLDFPSKQKMELQVTFSYGELRDNTILQNYDGIEKNISVGLIVQDNAGNKSDYVESDKILLKKL